VEEETVTRKDYDAELAKLRADLRLKFELLTQKADEAYATATHANARFPKNALASVPQGHVHDGATPGSPGAFFTVEEDNAVLGAVATLDFTEPDTTLVTVSGSEADIAMNLYALLSGRAGGQTLKGGTAAGEDLILQSTAHATPGIVQSIDDFEVQAGNVAFLDTIQETTSTHGTFFNSVLSLRNLLHWNQDAATIDATLNLTGWDGVSPWIEINDTGAGGGTLEEIGSTASTGHMIIVTATSAKTITIKHNAAAGNISCVGGADITLQNTTDGTIQEVAILFRGRTNRWVATKGAVAATTTVQGTVELATTAETTTGTSTTLVPPVSALPIQIQDSKWVYAADSVGTDAYAITLAPAPAAYAAGQVFWFSAGTANTGACTLNVNGLGIKTIKKNHDADLADNDIEIGSVIGVVYDGTNFQMFSHLGNAAAGGSAHTIQDEGTAVATQTVLNFIGTYNSAQNDAAATASDIRSGYAEMDAIVDSDQWEALVTDEADVVTGTSIQVTAPGSPGWVVDEWARCRVLIYDAAGTTLRDVKVITSNTADTINWSGAVAGIIATDTFIIQPSAPVYRRLWEAIKGGHLSIRYRKVSGEIAASIAITASHAVNVIIGDDQTDASITTAATCSKNGVVFDTLTFTNTLTVTGTGDTVVGCRFTGSNSQMILNGIGCAAINCAASGNAAIPFSIRSASCRVTACTATLLTSTGMIEVTAAATFYSVVGNVNVSSAETGYIIDVASGADGIITANVLRLPTTALGGISVSSQGNIAGNYIVLSTSTAATQDGILVSGRNAISGNVIRVGTLSTAVTRYAIHLTGSGNAVSSNAFIVAGMSHASAAAFLCQNDSILNTISGNVAYGVVLFTNGAAYVIGGTDHTAYGNVAVGATAVASPVPWMMYQAVSAKSNLFANTDHPDMRAFIYDRIEDFDDDLLPHDWDAGAGSGTTTFGSSAVGGVMVQATGAVNNQDRVDRFMNDVIAGSTTLPGFEAAFSLSSTDAERFRIGLGENATWATGMAGTRPTTGMFLEYDTTAMTGFTVGAGQTSRWNTNSGSLYGAGSSEVGAASVVMTWAINRNAAWAQSAVGIKPATAAVIPLFVAAGVGTGSGTTVTVSFDATGAGVNKCLFVGVSWLNEAGQTISSVTFNGAAMTLVSSSTSTHQRRCATAIYRRVAPDAVVGNVVVTFSASVSAAVVGQQLWQLVHQTTPAGTAVPSTNANLAVTTTVASATDEVVVDCVAAIASTTNFMFVVKTLTNSGLTAFPGYNGAEYDCGAASTTRNRVSAFIARRDHLQLYFSGARIGTGRVEENICVWPAATLVCPGIYTQTLAAVDKTATVDFIRWRCERT
jgi:hypothetical protein